MCTKGLMDSFRLYILGHFIPHTVTQSTVQTSMCEMENCI